jgi:hypothetical protein
MAFEPDTQGEAYCYSHNMSNVITAYNYMMNEWNDLGLYRNMKIVKFCIFTEENALDEVVYALIYQENDADAKTIICECKETDSGDGIYDPLAGECFLKEWFDRKDWNIPEKFADVLGFDNRKYANVAVIKK